jgi:hypothetical protein
MSFYPSAFSDFTAASRTTGNFQPGLFSEPSIDPTLSDEFTMISQDLHTHVVEPCYHDINTVAGNSPVAYNELSTAFTNGAPPQPVSVLQ